jgi:hypothetical protein
MFVGGVQAEGSMGSPQAGRMDTYNMEACKTTVDEDSPISHDHENEVRKIRRVLAESVLFSSPWRSSFSPWFDPP